MMIMIIIDNIYIDNGKYRKNIEKQNMGSFQNIILEGIPIKK